MRNKLLFSSILLAASVSLSAQQSATITLHADQGKQIIPKEIYGQFAEHLGTCIYGGLWVGENSDIPNIKGYRTDVFNALKDLQVPVLRWPGGCFADEYHWMDGIGPKENRPKMVNNNWGGTIEDNSFGTHEFLNLCEMLGCEPYISGNVGSGTVEELAKWVEYMTSDGDSPMANLRRKNGRDKAWKVKYLGVGNESWGCGGIPGATETIDIDLAIVSVGVSPNPIVPSSIKGLELGRKGTIAVNDNMESSIPMIYAGGDIVRGGATVILAMGDGRKAAAAMNEQLKANAGN